ncbi:MAG: AAC(3) family N-acetyltransferase [Desulfovibrionaceae bacterium]|jgi:aminoglycoside N3'-acetyltransferase|nr:AAC(3) family N-acetyltransferase [Desulfovibrionaceae bacterium]
MSNAAATARATGATGELAPEVCVPKIAATRARFVETLRSLGLERGADAFVVSDLAVCGLPECFPKAGPELLEFYHDGLAEAVGLDGAPGGTLACITYSFDFVRTRVYDSRTTRTKHGVLNEFLRTRPGAVRSLHPFGSCAALGANADRFMRDCGPSCFGQGSPFTRLIAADARCVVIGKRPGHVPLFHTAEQFVGVPYAYNKRLTGEVTHEGERVDREFTAFLRYKHLDVRYDFPFIYDAMEANVAHRKAPWLRASVAVFSMRAYYDWIAARYERDVHAFLLQPPDYAGDGPPA